MNGVDPVFSDPENLNFCLLNMDTMRDLSHVGLSHMGIRHRLVGRAGCSRSETLKKANRKTPAKCIK